MEAALVDQLQTYVLGEQALAMVIGRVRAEIEAASERHEDIAALEAELASVRAEQKRLAKPPPCRTTSPSWSPSCSSARRGSRNSNVRANVARLRQALADQADLREVFQAMFPDALTFEPARTPDGSRQVWSISGEANFHVVTGNRSDFPVSFASRPQRDSKGKTRTPGLVRRTPCARWL